jgi:hypothetical protein
LTATLAASSPPPTFDDPGSSSVIPAAGLTTVAAVVVFGGFLGLCARRFVDNLFPLEIITEPPDGFCTAGFTDGMAVVASPDGRTRATALALDAIHAKQRNFYFRNFELILFEKANDKTCKMTNIDRDNK